MVVVGPTELVFDDDDVALVVGCDQIRLEGTYPFPSLFRRERDPQLLLKKV